MLVVMFFLTLLGVGSDQAVGSVAAEPPTKDSVDGHCAEATFCYAVLRRQGRIKLRLEARARTGRYFICARHDHLKRCRDAKLPEKLRGITRDVVDFSRRFGWRAPGHYRASWYIDGARLGPPLEFQLP